jgi:hypothetical protein
MKTTPSNGPDMSGEQKKELNALRVEERRLIKAEGRRQKELLRAMVREEKRVERISKRLRAAAEAEIRAVEKETLKMVKPWHKEWTRLTQGKVKNERLAAVRHRIAILEGRVG